MQETNAERHLLELQLRSQRYKRLRGTSTTRVQPQRKPKIHSPDKIVFGDLKGTLGEKTLSVGYEVEINGCKSKCIALLSRNIITDFNNADQLKLIGIKLNQLSSRFQLSIDRVERDITELHKSTLKIENRVAGYNTVKYGRYTDLTLTLHIRIMYNHNIHLCRGDTTSPYLSVINLHFKLGFRLIVKDFNNDDLNITTGELARHSSTTSSKMNKDFIKSALTTKTHLNAALKRMSYIPPNKIKTVVAPMIQIMGLSCIVYGMNVVDKKVYTLQKLYSFNYPSILREVKRWNEGVIKRIWLSGTMIIEYSRTPTNTMRNIKNGRKKSTIAATTNIDEYISAVIPYPDSEDEQENEQENE
ncbi:hypothetical protein G6F56_000237 [Rhizopus delemar]|nr:hypothetical protein G6F56_000237 [Rhizopus delemar]